MAIASSKLGKLVAEGLLAGDSHADKAIVRRLREAALVVPEAREEDLIAVFEKARQEHLAFGEGRHYNSPHERVRVFLGPYLSDKGKAWAMP